MAAGVQTARRVLPHQFQLMSSILPRPLVRLALIAFVWTLATGAALAALVPGDYEFYLTHQGFRRSYLLHVPA